MKRVLIFILIAGLAVSFVHAKDDGIGLTVGAEFGIDGINRPDDAEEFYPFLVAPFVIYEHSFLDGALDFYTEAGFVIGFWDEYNQDGETVKPMSGYFDLSLGYNIFLSHSSTLTFSLGNLFDDIMFTPRFEDSNNMTGIVTPAIRFNQEMDFGDLFFQAAVPITYMQHDKDADTEFAFHFTAGWVSDFGPYFQLKAEIPRNMNYGFSLVPYFSYAFPCGWELFASCRFDHIAVDGMGVSISPALGVSFSF
jgi:hypothetical protein